MPNIAPYKIKKRDGKFAVVNNANMTKATFDDRDKAVQYLRALYVNVKGAAKKADRMKWSGKAPKPKDKADMAAEIFKKCDCGRQFATEDGFNAHYVSLHDAEPDPVENAINDAKTLLDTDNAAVVKPGDRDKGGMSDGSYPVTTQAQANSAWKLRGHSKNHSEAEVVAHIRRRVKALGLKMPGGDEASLLLTCCDRVFATERGLDNHVQLLHAASD